MRIRTGFSFRAAVGTPEEVMSRLKEVGAQCAPISDRASTFGWAQWAKLAKKEGLKPLFGVELAVTDSVSAKKPIVDYWTFYAIDDIIHVNRLLHLATTQFRYEPLLTYEQAALAEGVIKIVGNRSQLDLFEPRDDLYVALSPSTSKGYFSAARAKGHKFIASSDNKFPRKEDEGFYEVVVGRGASAQTYPQHILSPEEWSAEAFRVTGALEPVQASLATARDLPGLLNATLKQASLLAPDRPETLEAMCRAGAVKLGVDLRDPVYEARLIRELRLIEEKKFEDYFYIIADMMEFARKVMICGPARGSSCGSLVCYLLQITTIDPLKYDLIFERFIDITRADLPDIDLDFSDQKRQLVFDYMEHKYGRDHIARLGTVALFRPRSAISEAGAALKVPGWICDKVVDSLLVRSSGDSRALQTLEDTLMGTPAGKDLLAKYPEIIIASRMEGHPRHYCLSGDTLIAIGQTNHVLKGSMSIKSLYEMFVENPSEDTARLARKGKPRMPVLISMMEDGICHPQKAAKIWFAGEKDCIRLTFDNGSSVDCTPSHRFLINGVWKPCGEAHAGDEFMAMDKREKLKGKRGWPVGLKRPDMANITGPLKSGEEHPNFRHGTKAKMLAFRESHIGRPCESCDKEDDGNFDIHHLDFCHGKEKPDDMAWLCKRCHRMEHGQQQKRWSKGISTSPVKLVKAEFLGKRDTYDIEMPEHHNFALANGIIASNSQHAAGIVVTDKPVLEYVAMDARTGATFCNKHDAEDLNLLKIDALGLTQLSVFEDALVMAGKDHHFLDTIPLNDPKAFDVLNKRQFSGIFQFNGQALQSISKQISVEALEDIIAITAMARPGPMASGGTGSWIKRKRGEEAVSYAHPLFIPYLKKTLGIVAYQEQIMEIARHIGGLSWEDVSSLRKAMSKSLGKEFFDQFGNRFKAGAIEKGVPAEILDKLWADLCSFGSWAFNRSHSVAYGMISYYCCYMKVYFPFEFAAATLSHEPDPSKQIQILREMAEEGFDYVPIDKDQSTDKWTAGYRDGKKVLIGPLTGVKGVGPKMVAGVLSSRARNEPLPARVEKLLANPKTEIDSLWPVRTAFKRLMPDPSARNIFTPPVSLINIQPTGDEYRVLAFVTFLQIKPRDDNDAQNVAKRGGRKVSGQSWFLNLTMADDTDRILGKIRRWDFDKLAKDIIDRGRPGKALYAVKGTVPKSFRMIQIEQVRYIGDMDDKDIVEKTAGEALREGAEKANDTGSDNRGDGE